MVLPKSTKDFLQLNFKQQVHVCSLMWLKANRYTQFVGGKMNGKYFVVKGYFMKIPTQTIKNIAIMLMEQPRPCDIKDMVRCANDYVRKKQTREARKVAQEVTSEKEYDVDLLGFLKEG